MYIFHLPMHATSPAHLIFIALIILFEEYKVWSNVLLSSRPLRPNIPLSITFPNTLNVGCDVLTPSYTYRAFLL
jgi:hypothetical protein